MENLSFKLHQIGGEAVLAVADKSVLGKKYEGGGRVLDLQTFRYFYEGETASANKIASLLSECSSANLVGKQACAIAIQNNWANPKDIVDIGGISHLHLYNFSGNKK